MLMLSTGLLSGLGFLYWSVGTHTYTSDDVGLATAALAVLNLVTSASLLGFEIAIIRVLPGHPTPSRVLSACLGISLAIGLTVVLVLMLLGPTTWEVLGTFSALGVAGAALLGIAVIASVYSYMTESVFISLRASRFVVAKNAVFGVLKLLALPALALWGAAGIFGSWILGLIAADVLAVWILSRRHGISALPIPRLSAVRGMLRYSLGNYVASFLEGLPIMVLPLLVVDLFGASSNAHYYMAMTLATLLFVVPVAVTQALFAEVSNDDELLRRDTVRATKLIAVLLIPACLVFWIAGDRLLGIFGSSYAAEGEVLLVLLAASSWFVAGSSIARTVLKLRYHTSELVWISAVGSAVILVGAVVLRAHGLTGVGIAWLLGQALMCLLLCLSARRVAGSNRSGDQVPSTTERPG